MHTEGIAHGPATLFMHTGSINLVRPSVGAWTLYGLGTENQNLPGFITICPSMGNGGPRNWSNAFLPSAFQGTPIGWRHPRGRGPHPQPDEQPSAPWPSSVASSICYGAQRRANRPASRER